MLWEKNFKYLSLQNLWVKNKILPRNQHTTCKHDGHTNFVGVRTREALNLHLEACNILMENKYKHLDGSWHWRNEDSKYSNADDVTNFKWSNHWTLQYFILPLNGNGFYVDSIFTMKEWVFWQWFSEFFYNSSYL